jgi:tetratricopeptide (TPR) repeat protein
LTDHRDAAPTGSFGPVGRGETTAPGAAATAPLAPQLLEGEVLAGRYCVQRFLARGGGGEVYEAEDLELGVRVALKTLSAGDPPDGGRVERFRREIQLARLVTHPNVCRLYDFGRHSRRTGDGTREFLFLTMELLPGPTLAQHLTDCGPLPPDEALPIVRQMAAALQAAHRAGVVHRDFKSANVILVPDAGGAGGMRAVVTDFGLARGHLTVDSGPTVTATGLIVGSPAYMAPEQVEGGAVTPAADLYAFGVVLYEMATGAFPFAGDSALSIAVKRLNEPPIRPSEKNPSIDPRWERVILRCLERRPDDRFHDAQGIAEALDPAAPLPSRSGHRGRRRAVLAAAAVAVLVAGWFASRAWRARSPTSPGAALGALSNPAAVVPRRSVAVLGFENLSREADTQWLETAFAELLDAQLSTGGSLRVVSGETIARVRKELGLERALALSPETLSKLRANLGSDYILTGSYLAQGRAGDQRLRLNLRLQSAESGETETVSGEDSVDQLFRLADGVGADLRRRLGVVANATNRADLEAVPRDTEAARLYSEGLNRLRARDLVAARELLEQAVRLDPTNAAVHSSLAEAWFLQGYDKRALAEAQIAFERSAGLTGENRLLIEARFRALSRDWERAIALYSSLCTMEPDDPEHLERLTRTQSAAAKWKDALATLDAAYARHPAMRDDPRLAVVESELRWRISDYAGVVATAERARRTAEAQGAKILVAQSLHWRGQGLLSLGRKDEARQAFEGAASLFRELDDREGEALTSRSLALVQKLSGDLDQAYRTGLHALEELRRIGNQRHAVAALNTLANIRYEQSRLEEAARLYDEILLIGRDTEDLRAQAAALGNLGNVYFLQGDLGRAITAQREALRFKREMGDRAGTATTLVSLAVALLDHVEPAQAIPHLEEATALAREIGSRAIEASALHVLAEARFHTGDALAAESLFTTARAAQLELGDTFRATEGSVWLLIVDVDQGDWKAVLAAAPEVIRAAREIEAANLEAAAHGTLAQALAATGDDRAAAQEAQFARRQAEDDEDLSMRWSTLAQAWRVDAALAARGRQSAKPVRELQNLADQAASRGFTRHSVELQLLVEEAGLGTGTAPQPGVRARLGALAERAGRAGFGRIAERARALASGALSPLAGAANPPAGAAAPTRSAATGG